MSNTLHINGVAVTIDILERKANEIRFSLDGRSYRFIGHMEKDGAFLLDEEMAADEWQRSKGVCWQAAKGTWRVQLGSIEAKISEAKINVASVSGAAQLSPLAPMPGMVRSIMVKKGDAVVEGQALVVFEAMKLQLTLTAGGDAVVAAVSVREGQIVSEGAELVKLIKKIK